ncbi:hypothetical protein ABZP36_004873 [Zizania latifolia]
MSAPMPTIHSLTAPPRAPAPATATPPLRRRTSTASTSPESPRPPQALRCLPSRRAALLALILVSSTPRPAAAFSLGIPGPKELLREQKKKSARFLLAPIAASREILLKAQSLLASANVGAEDAEEVGRLLGAAGRDCVPRKRNSLVALQSRTGVEVCTFSLILKNAASLLTDKDPLKVEADTRLAELIQSFSDLGTVVDNSNFELTADRVKMKDGFLSTISAIGKFEQAIKDCLGI